MPASFQKTHFKEILSTFIQFAKFEIYKFDQNALYDYIFYLVNCMIVSIILYPGMCNCYKLYVSFSIHISDANKGWFMNHQISDIFVEFLNDDIAFYPVCVLFHDSNLIFQLFYRSCLRQDCKCRILPRIKTISFYFK